MVTPEVRSEIETGSGPVGAAWIGPGVAVATLVLAHGAGAGMDHPFMAGFARAIAGHSVATLRFNFPYVERGRRSPDAEGVLRATWLAVFEDARARSEDRPVLAGGKSLGGRIASMTVADGMPAAGLVFLGYPFHPPGKPERVRDEHLYRITVPMLFIQGTADPFAKPETVRRVLGKLGRAAEHVPIEGGDHSFNVRGQKRDAREVGETLAGLAAPFVLRVAGAG
jgi:predicted alpha/beta-hydrolase family hydrolase